MKAASVTTTMSLFARAVLSLAVLLAPFAGVQAAHSPAIIPVTTTIQAAIDAAGEGDTISIPAGLYIENLTVNKSLTLAALAGAGGNYATIWPNGNARIITVEPGHNLTLKDLVLAGGFPDGAGSNEGGAVLIQNGTLTVDHCYLYSNKGSYGGAIRQAGTGQVIVQNDSHIYTNLASIDGGAIYADGNVSLSDFVVEYNQANRHGGGVAAMCSLFSAARGRFTGNTAAQNGGGVNTSNNVHVDTVTFIQNTAGASGGALLQWNGDNGLLVNIQHATFDANQAGATGGAVSVYQGASTTIDHTTFLNNQVDTGSTADPKGGAVYFADASRGHDLTIQNSVFESNTLDCVNCWYPMGGGVYAETSLSGAIILSGDRFSENDAWLGGGVYAGRAVIDRTTFQGNTGGSGGGAYLLGEAQITSSAFEQNRVANGGGGLVVTINPESLTLEDTRFTGNAGGINLGGAFTAGAEQIVLKNVAVADTQVTVGQAVSFDNPAATLQVFHLTVNDTHLANGQRTGTVGVYINGIDSCSFWNSMITNHGTGVKLNTSSACTLDHTLWHGNGLDIDGPALSYSNDYPVYANPAYAVDRYHLASGSGAIDQGVDRLVYHDIDGDTRVNPPDLGADEYQAHVYLPVILR